MMSLTFTRKCLAAAARKPVQLPVAPDTASKDTQDSRTTPSTGAGTVVTGAALAVVVGTTLVVVGTGAFLVVVGTGAFVVVMGTGAFVVAVVVSAWAVVAATHSAFFGKK